MINISLPDGSVRSFDKPVSGADIAASIGPGLAKAALALRVDGKMKDLAHVVDHDASIGIVTSRDPEALQSALSLSAERRAEVARAAQEQVRSRYSLAQANRQLLQLYERLG